MRSARRGSDAHRRQRRSASSSCTAWPQPPASPRQSQACSWRFAQQRARQKASNQGRGRAEAKAFWGLPASPSMRTKDTGYFVASRLRARPRLHVCTHPGKTPARTRPRGARPGQGARSGGKIRRWRAVGRRRALRAAALLLAFPPSWRWAALPSGRGPASRKPGP